MNGVLNPFVNLKNLNKIDVTDELLLIKIYEDLLIKEISSEASIIEFLNERDILEMHITNEMSESYFLMTTNVADQCRQKRKEHFEQVVCPIYRQYEEKLNKKFLDSEFGKKLGPPFDILRRNQKSNVDLFSDKNLEIFKEIDVISSKITEIQGKMMATWQGERVPLPAVTPFLKSHQRDIRKSAFECINNAKLEVFDQIDSLFDELLKLRHAVAKNAGFESFTKYRFIEMQRYDWGESDCFLFHHAIKKHILPLRDKILEKRKANLKLATLKPYDLNVDIYGREPLRIYEKGQSQNLIEGAGKIIKAIDLELYDYFCKMRDNHLLDLEARENKSPGGYMLMYPIYELASVFYNGVGLADDLMVLLHELGHSFHYFLGKDIRPYALQTWTAEVAEGGSMSMEFIGLEKMHEYLDGESCKKIKEDRLMSTI